MAEQDLVVVIFEIICESQSLLVFIAAWFFQTIFLIFDVVTCSQPACIIFVLILLRKYTNFHALVVQTIWFTIIHQIKLDFGPFTCVLHAEVKPLNVPLGIYVILQQ